MNIRHSKKCLNYAISAPFFKNMQISSWPTCSAHFNALTKKIWTRCDDWLIFKWILSEFSVKIRHSRNEWNLEHYSPSFNIMKISSWPSCSAHFDALTKQIWTQCDDWLILKRFFSNLSSTFWRAIFWKMWHTLPN